jgi:hypothetical protein
MTLGLGNVIHQPDANHHQYDYPDKRQAVHGQAVPVIIVLIGALVLGEAQDRKRTNIAVTLGPIASPIRSHASGPEPRHRRVAIVRLRQPKHHNSSSRHAPVAVSDASRKSPGAKAPPLTARQRLIEV